MGPYSKSLYLFQEHEALGRFTPHHPPPQPGWDGMLYVVHHNFAPCNMRSVDTKSETCEGRGNIKIVPGLRNQVTAQRRLKSVGLP